MNRKIFFTIFSTLLFAAQVFAQPGGGDGGLVIENVYNSKLERINLPADTSLKIRTFILAKGSVIEETFVYQEILQMYQELQKQFDFEAIQRMSHYEKDIELSCPGIDDIHRMYIIYKKDTMIVDFDGIMGPPGYGDYMDSLVIQKGYFRYNRFDNKRNKWQTNTDYLNTKCIQNGLTPFTTKQLGRTGYIHYDSTIDLSFIDEKNLNVLYFEHQALDYLRLNQGKLALANIAKAIEKNNGNKTCRILHLLFSVYLQTGQYEQALEVISSGMYCPDYNSDRWYEDVPESKTIDAANYTRRISLYQILKQYDKALNDYDSLCANYKDAGNSYKGSRGIFKLHYLKDYEGAIADLKEAIDEAPDYTFCYYNQDKSGRYSIIYFNLAEAEYLSGDKRSAFMHWLIGAERGYRQPVATSYPPVASSHWTIYYDSIIHQNPTVPEMYLVRGIAYMQVGKSLDRDKKVSNESFAHALQDIHSAEELGITDYRINMYRAVVLYEQQKYDEAMAEIDLAIGKDNTVPECFDIRYKIRLELKQAQWNQEDVDLIRLRKLAEDWTWDKW